jgi:glycine cleavage system regulatory protein
MASLILTMVGPDRPGLVGLVSEQVANHGGSWLESRLAHLAGQCAGIVRIEIADAAVDKLRHSLAEACGAELAVTLHPAPGTTTNPSVEAPALLMLDLLCQDRPGILRDVTRILTAAGVNIEELTTDLLSGSFSGEHMFHAEARLRLPQATTADALRTELEALGEELMVDFTLTEHIDG